MQVCKLFLKILKKNKFMFILVIQRFPIKFKFVAYIYSNMHFYD